MGVVGEAAPDRALLGWLRLGEPELHATSHMTTRADNQRRRDDIVLPPILAGRAADLERRSCCILLYTTPARDKLHVWSSPAADDGKDAYTMTETEFQELMQRLAGCWSRGDASAAAGCFTEDAVYMEPPDRQLYVGRDELYRFFGGDQGRAHEMSMRWHLMLFDARTQVGMGEFTFGYGGQVHGVALVQISDGHISKWREYWYESDQPYETFVGPSAF